MDDDALDSIPALGRVSVRAVLVRDGEDPGPALAEAGIFEPVAIPVALADGAAMSGGILGDGITPNLVGVLESDAHQGFDAAAACDPVTQPGPEDLPAPVTTTVPPAFGFRSFAPAGRVGRSTGKQRS